MMSGNHESDGSNGTINDFSACLPNQLPGLVGTYGRQYYVDVPQTAPLVRFVMISPALTLPDGTYSYDPGNAALQLDGRCHRRRPRGRDPLGVVGMHKPCLSLGQYTCEVGAGLINMLVSKKVDLVPSGHEHLYQRTRQLGLSPSCPALTPGTVYRRASSIRTPPCNKPARSSRPWAPAAARCARSLRPTPSGGTSRPNPGRTSPRQPGSPMSGPQPTPFRPGSCRRSPRRTGPLRSGWTTSR